jgi:hypothetical protein
MALPANADTIPAIFTNKSYIMVGSEMLRIVFVDERQQQGRDVLTELVVAEIVLTHYQADLLANEINAALHPQVNPEK